jgi:hypothetical protein
MQKYKKKDTFEIQEKNKYEKSSSYRYKKNGIKRVDGS